MALSAWPGTVNQAIYREGYGQKPDRNVAVFQPEIGPPIQRRRSGISTDVVTCAGRGTQTEFNNLMAFYRTTLLDGVLQFTRNHPLTGAALTICQFVEAPAITSSRATFVQFSLQLRIFN